MNVTASPVVGHDAIGAYRISSCNFERPNIRAWYSYEKFSGETTLAVKDETTDRNEPFSGSVETIASVHSCIRAMLSVLRLNPASENNYNQRYLQQSISEGHVVALLFCWIGSSESRHRHGEISPL